MNTIKFRKKQARVVAHRGLSGIEKENTTSAFVAAGNHSYFAIETDIHRTIDGHFVINHDPDFMRVAGVNLVIEESTLEQIQNIVLYDMDGTKNRNDLRPCVLENYLAICKRYDKNCVLELKSDFTQEEILKIIDIARSFEYLDRIMFISFNYDNLLKIRSVLPSHPAAYLFWGITDEILDQLERDKIDVDVYHDGLTQKQIDNAHSRGLSVNCWTVNERAEGSRLAKWGIDYITTNILE
ncbi:MAG: hypothetical protein IKB27_03920 [Clostridia bacterium]|nr:hypothetical protein [Clostridia bacterium]